MLADRLRRIEAVAPKTTELYIAQSLALARPLVLARPPVLALCRPRPMLAVLSQTRTAVTARLLNAFAPLEFASRNSPLRHAPSRPTQALTDPSKCPAPLSSRTTLKARSNSHTGSSICA